MGTMALGVYHRLPSPVRSLAATLRGRTLRQWRYGAETDRLVHEAFEREQWSPAQWTRWREARLQHLLHRAVTRVPYYRDLWASRRRRGDTRSWERLEHWPILDKDAVRSAPRLFVADDCKTSQMFHEHTSGTTGKALDLWWSKRTVREWYALFEARCRLWHGVSRDDRWAILGGQLVVPSWQKRPPFWVWNAALHQLYMSAYHLAPDSVESYVDALKRHRITYLWGYPSALYELAVGALGAGHRVDVDLRVVVTNAEPLLPYQRETIRRAFRCEVRETYGMAEIVAAASECPHGRLHEWPDVGMIETLEGGEAVSAGSVGDLVATGLLNDDMPLIRYAVGDRLAMARPSMIACECGKRLPVLASVDGRSDDTLVTRDGRRIGRLDPVFKAGLPIYEAQILQESLDRIRIRYVPAPGFTSRDERALEAAVRARMGEVEIVLEPLVQIPRTANGKFRAVVCQIPREQRLDRPA
jgi:phenylacetate-CoA ligase